MRVRGFGLVGVIVIVFIVAAIACACAPREPGPGERELGEVQFWEVTGDGEVTFGDACTDSPNFRDGIEAPEFEPNSFLIFKIADDGATATAQSCERIDPDTCEDSDVDIVFDIDIEAHTYTATLETQVTPTSSPGCDLELAQVWTLEDQGETLTLDVDLPAALIGDPAACAAAEAAVIAEGTNGEGIDGCVVNLHVDTEFTASL
jgi:uncharacterized Zn-binding protein involved in type VI secretion